MMISLFDRVENTVGKGENAAFQHFLLFPKCFPKCFPKPFIFLPRPGGSVVSVSDL